MTVGIVGGGPAGMSAALWLKQLGMEVLVVERASELGGLQRLNFLENPWILGEIGKTGSMIAKTFAAHLQAIGIQSALSTELCFATREHEGFRLSLRSPHGLSDHFVSAIILAIGTRFREQEVLAHIHNLAEIHPERLVWGPYAFQNMKRFAGQRVLVVGGGDNAHEFIRLAEEVANTFILAARSRRKAQQSLRTAVDELAMRGRCKILEQTMLEGIDQSESSLLVEFSGNPRRCEEVDSIVILAGYEPDTGSLGQFLSPALKAELRLDPNGYVLADCHGRTASLGIYAAGDVINPAVPCVVSALASGAVAARAVESDLRNQQT